MKEFNYEQLPIHSLYPGNIISKPDFNKLDKTEQKNWVKTERQTTCLINRDNQGIYLEKINSLWNRMKY